MCHIFDFKVKYFGTPIAKYIFMMRWLAVAYIVVVLVISAKARANSNDVLFIDHKTCSANK
jgi:hypothetical protein